MSYSNENTSLAATITNGNGSGNESHLEACYDSFLKHWQQINDVLKKYQDENSGAEVKFDDVLTVINNLNQITALINLELRSEFHVNKCIEYLLNENFLEQLSYWSIKNCNQNDLRLELLVIYEVLCTLRENLLTYEQYVMPLLRLLSSFSDGCVSVDIEKRLVILVTQLCFSLSQYPQLLIRFFPSLNPKDDISTDIFKFDIFSLLVQFVHRDGMIGDQARQSLLICMSMSQQNSSVAEYITLKTDICPVLGACLSGLYSMLPRKLTIDTPDWFRFGADDVYELKELTNFIHSLEFCNAVTQICHPDIKNQLTDLIYQAFLVPVMGPALLQSTEEEVIAASAYFELSLRSVTHPGLLHSFIKFIFKENFDGHRVIDCLIQRINSTTSKLCVMTLSLLETLIDLNNEEIMVELILRHLIPCTHVMSSQRTKLQYLDPLSKSSDKFLALTVNLAQFNSKCMQDETYNNYGAYSRNARYKIQVCLKATSNWLYPYDGENPPCIVFSKHDDLRQTVENDQEHNSLSADDGSSGYESFKAYKDTEKVYQNTDETNPPSPCGSEAALEYRTDYVSRMKLFHHQLISNSTTKKSTPDVFNTTPCIGPFLNVLMQKVEDLLTCDFYVLLRLTGVISRLAIYPQPLIHSFLLDHSLVFQPSIKSLIQVLGLLKQRIESRLKEVHNVSTIVHEASAFLVQRLDNLNNNNKIGGNVSIKSSSDSPSSLPVSSSQENFTRVDNKRKSFSIAIGNMFKRNSINSMQDNIEPLAKGSGYRFIKSDNSELRNIVVCSIIFNEWLKELSAIVQEHAILRSP